MEEPVILSSGFTYEKSEIQKHFKANGLFDPQTRSDVKETLILNQNIKHATEDFLRENPWAYEYSQYDNINSIMM